MANNTVSYTLEIRQTTQEAKKLAQLQHTVDRTRQSLKKLTAIERRAGGVTRRTSAARAQLTTRLQAQNNALRDNRRTLLQNNNALRQNSGFVAGISQGLAGFAKSLIGPMAVIGLATAAIGGIVKAIGGAIQKSKEFEQANANLQAVLGISAGEMSELRSEAKRLGSTSAFTATQVTELQTELGKLGFDTSDIKEMTGGVLRLSAALGTELGETASFVGSNLRAFGLEADQTGRIVDVFAKAASSSSLDMAKMSTALATVGPVAKNAGSSIERTTALLAKLSDNGLDASTAGTGLRNVFLELSKQGLTMDEALGKIAASTDKNKTALELFGKRGAVIGTILSDVAFSAEGTVTAVDLLEQKLISAGGTADRMARTQLNTLEGKIKLAESAWEGLTLAFDQGNGPMSRLAKGFQTLKANVFNFLTPAADVTLGLRTQQIEMNNLVGELKVLAANQDKTTAQTMRMKDVMSQLDIVNSDVLDGVIDLVTDFDALRGALNENDEAANGLVSELESLESQENLTNEESQRAKEIRDDLNALYPELLANSREEKINLDALAASQIEQNKAMEDNIALAIQQARVDETLRIQKETNSEIARLSEQRAREEATDTVDENGNVVRSIDDRVNALKALIEHTEMASTVGGIFGVSGQNEEILRGARAQLESLNREKAEFDQQRVEVEAKTLDELKALQDSFKTSTLEKARALFDDLSAVREEGADAEIAAAEAGADAASKARDEAAKLRLERMKLERNAEHAIIADSEERAIQIARDKTADKLSQISEKGILTSDLRLNIEERLQRDIVAIQDKFADQKTKEDEEVAKKALSEALALAKDASEVQKQQTISLRNEISNLKALELKDTISQLEAEIEIREAHGEKVVALETKLIAAKQSLIAEESSAQIDAFDGTLDELNELYDEGLITYNDFEQEKTDILNEQTDERIKADQRAMDSAEAMTEKFAMAALKLFETQEEISEQKKADLKGLEAALQADEVSYSEYIAAKQDIEQTAQEEQKQAKKDFWRKEILGTMITTIATSTALAFAQPDSVATFGTTGAIRAGILSGLIGAAGAFAVSALDKFEGGGELSGNGSGVLTGPSHNNGGIRTIVGGKRAVETEGGEVVIAKGVTKNSVLYNEASRLNVLSGGRALPGAVQIGPAAFSPLDGFYEDGGTLNSDGVSRPVPADTSGTSQSALDISGLAEDMGNVFAQKVSSLRVINVASETADVNKVTNLIENESLLG